MNEALTYDVLQEAVNRGVREFVLCAGSRNSSFVEALRLDKGVRTYYWPEERSAAFFALGRSKKTRRPVAVITTSGTAVGELLPAAMEAYHTGIPLLLITADRPTRFRDSGAPQSCLQPHIFGCYTTFFCDVEKVGEAALAAWDLDGPAHVNVCLEEPQTEPAFKGQPLNIPQDTTPGKWKDVKTATGVLDNFIGKVKHPFVVVSTLQEDAREAAVRFLCDLGAPVMLEGISNLREEPRLQHLRIKSTEKVFETAEKAGYTIDGVLRIGGIPTHRFWRDIEYKEGKILLCGISEAPFSGISWNREVIQGHIGEFLTSYQLDRKIEKTSWSRWKELDTQFYSAILQLFTEEPHAEPSLINKLSTQINNRSFVYLGNSLPIREWDLAADNEYRKLSLSASRGLNGIDGQISTFFGLCRNSVPNWAILGDLTSLYDLVGPWITQQLGNIDATIVIVNNGGGQIFSRLYPYQEMLNAHALNFEPLAKFWGLRYQRLTDLQDPIQDCKGVRIIELQPNELATKRFWNKMSVAWKTVTDQDLALASR